MKEEDQHVPPLPTSDKPPNTYHGTRTHYIYHVPQPTRIALYGAPSAFRGDETPYERLHAVVSCRIKPWFDVFVGTTATTGKEAGGGGGGGEASTGDDEKKVCRARFESVAWNLIVHPVIQPG